MQTVNDSSLTITLKTCNDFGIWTGGVKPTEMYSVKPTSLLGSMRSWTEALLRANGKYVCNKSCIYSADDDRSACDLCKIFGCTGLSRIFNFSVEAPNLSKDKIYLKGRYQQVKLSKYTHEHFGKQKVPTYYLTNGYVGQLKLSLVPRRLDVSTNTLVLPKEIPTALYIMIKYGTIGAYSQYGCGHVDFSTPEDEEHLLSHCLASSQDCQLEEGRNLRDYFFFKGNIQGNRTQMMGELRFQIRDAIRKAFPGNQDLRHWFCGSVGRSTFASHYSYTISNEGFLHGWGFYPSGQKSSPFSAEREKTLDTMCAILKQSAFAGKSLEWRECNSKRDTSAKLPWPKFYDALLHDNWRNA